jgi:hypothetical protein
MKRRRRDVESTSLSFLDAICCGFGAVILLLVISKIFEPVRLEESRDELDGLLARYEQELEDIIGQTEIVNREFATTIDDLEINEQQIADLKRELVRIRSSINERKDDAEFSSELEGRLAQAKQRLTEEMQRLLTDYRPPLEDYKVGGIPVDSEYIIFIVDTSGSMQSYAWGRVQDQIRETLQVYPTVKGIQIMNDEGTYMFKGTRGDWMPDTATTRDAIINDMRNWDDFSDSSPREGILAAIDTFYDPNKKISLYVYSDDFSRGSISAVVREIDRRNKADEHGNRRVRIHAVAFPVFWQVYNELHSAANFAILMRAICQRNGGTFVALPLQGRR